MKYDNIKKNNNVRKVCFGTIAFTAISCGLYVTVALLWHGNNKRTVAPDSYNTLVAGNKPMLYFKDIGSDSCFTDLSLEPDSVVQGRPIDITKENLQRVIKCSRHKIAMETSVLDSIADEMRYYLGVHDVQDEGFDMVASHYDAVCKSYERLQKIDSLLHCVSGDTTVTVINSIRPDSIENYTSIFLACDGGIWKNARWSVMPKNGYGVALDYSGRPVCGLWHSDTLTLGHRTDSTGTYFGQFDSNLSAAGHGRYTSNKSVSYYEGHWYGDARDGFGFEVNTDRIRAGEWHAGFYRGERMHYTSERIYGIDISRYQHGKGRKYYPIHWDKLRITHLGNISKKRISGTVDYPVSFVYIKSTEGVSVRNRFYADDYRKARRHGLRCGAYHFFSVKSGAVAQAKYFIRNTFFQKGDFPPVLDVEPSNNQIQSMGGEKVLLDAIRTWMKIVKQHTGVRPILYVNQTFVNRYLADAPDIKRDYNIWIARYGEYRPDVRLIYWQLCPDGRISGIHGDVDINVFNGYKDKFDVFLENELIK